MYVCNTTCITEHLLCARAPSVSLHSSSKKPCQLPTQHMSREDFNMYPSPKDDNGMVLQGSQQRGKFPLGISVCSYSALPFGSNLALLHRQKKI